MGSTDSLGCWVVEHDGQEEVTPPSSASQWYTCSYTTYRCLQFTTDVQLTPQSTSGSHHGTCSSTSPCEVEPQGLSAASDDAYHDLKPLQDRHEVLYLSWKAVPYPGSISDFEDVLGCVWLIYVCYDCWSEVAALLRDADAVTHSKN